MLLRDSTELETVLASNAFPVASSTIEVATEVAKTPNLLSSKIALVFKNPLFTLKITRDNRAKAPKLSSFVQYS